MIGRGLQFLGAVLFYGYFQKVSASGFLVATALGLRFLTQKRWVPSVAFLVYLATLYVQVESIQSAVYLILASFLVWHNPGEQDDTVVRFQPYEEEIRQYLFKHDHTVLHKVDGWLAKYAGKELELYERVKAKYGPAPPSINETAPPPPVRISKPPEPQFTPSSGSRGYSFKDDSSPLLSGRPSERVPSSTSSVRPLATPNVAQRSPFQFSPYSASYYNDDVKRMFATQSGSKPSYPVAPSLLPVESTYSAPWSGSNSYPRSTGQLGRMESRSRYQEGNT